MVLETIVGWAIPFVLGTIVTGIISFIKMKLSKDRKKDRAIEEGVQALLRNELVRRYREYEIKGELSILDKENIEAMFKQYENLGGNGTVKHLMEELLNLPTKVIKE